MVYLMALAESVKTAISGVNATSSTVTTLQSLLSSASGAPSKASTTTQDPRNERTTSRTSRPAKPSRAPAKPARKDQKVQVLEDEPRSLALKAGYALATEVVNTALKVLSDASRQPARLRSHARRSSVQISATPKRAPTTPASQRGLKQISGNETPVTHSPLKQPGSQRRPSQCSISGSSPSSDHLVPTAECARLGFSFLRSIDLQKLGVREPPKLQLETGMLALCGKLITLELHSLAAKELRAVKRMLESTLGSRPTSSKASSGTSQPRADSETLSSLLQLSIAFDACPDAWPLIINFQLYVLQLIAASHQPGMIEEVFELLATDSLRTPASLIRRQVKDGGDRGKASKQLASLSRIILQLCPNVASSADALAKDASRSRSPLVVFKLQTMSLQLRQESWRLSRHEGDVEKELIDPFSKCLAALVRRLPSQKSTVEVFNACKDAYGILPTANGPSSKFVILRTLSILAGRASLEQEALDFAQQLSGECQSLGNDHARFVTAMARKSSALSKKKQQTSDIEQLCAGMNTICESLRKSLSGTASEYEALFAELAELVNMNHITPEIESLGEVRKRLAGSVAGFTSSYVRSFPDKNIEIAQEVIQSALSQCGSNESLLGWVTKDTAQVLIRSGVLRRVAEKVSSKSAALAWTSFSSAMTLARVLKLVTLKSIATRPEDLTKCIVDDPKSSDEERGALIEWQLKCALDVAHKTKYQPGLKSFLPECFQRLANTYSDASFPIRRARVIIQAYRIREQFPELIAPHQIAALINTPVVLRRDRLAKDEGLAAYEPSIRASLELSAAFYRGLPTVDDLGRCLSVFEETLDSIDDPAALEHTVDDLSLVQAQLTSTFDYLEIIGDDTARLKAAKLLSSIGRATGVGQEDGVVRQSRTYISLGYAEKAGEVLSYITKTSGTDEVPSLETLNMLICRAEHLLAMQDLDECQKMLETVSQTRKELQSKAPRLLQTSRYRVLLGRAWLLASRWMLEGSSAHESLSAAKRAVKVMNSIWSGLERSALPTDNEIHPDNECEDPAVEEVTNKVSKLVLKPEAKTPEPKATQRKGAAFWPVAALLCQALMHLGDVYVHQGVFNEANYASEQALKFAEAIDSSNLLSRVRYHRSTLLATAGRLEDAELCLAHDPNEDTTVPPLVRIEYFRAKALLAVKNGDNGAATRFYEKAEALVRQIQSDQHLASLDRPREVNILKESEAAAGTESKRSTSTTTSRKQTTTAQARQKVSTTRKAGVKTVVKKTENATASPKDLSKSRPKMLARLEASILLDKAMVSLDLGRIDEESLARLKDLAAALPKSFKSQRLEHEGLMRKVYSDLQADFSFNVLPESTLSFPALQVLDQGLSTPASEGSLVSKVVPKPPTKTIKRGKAIRANEKPAQSLDDLLCSARRCILPDNASVARLSTSETHRQNLLIVNASMVLSATSAHHASDVLHPIQEALTVDYGKIHASECYASVAKMDRDAHWSLDPLAWPETAIQPSATSTTAKNFGDQYANLLPSSWTAVSMTLNEQCDELYITRYRSSQSPLIIRLPFSRQRSDEADDEVFDFEMGKDELKEIIELSNYSCHNSLDTKAKGAKTNWWNEREALDRRLQELLINMENLWLGGFKGIFSQHTHQQDQLDRFRRSFEAVMDRHLPSRKSIKKGSKKLALDDHVLELFIGLGSDQDGEVDLDESLADLLYFIVDILQFNGERNAYDEIDFDSMAIDILDALRTYHDSVEEQSTSSAHLILVLDKRLQAFPWESLPCLERCSVSRVDSMLTLKDRLAQMKRKRNSDNGQYMIPRGSGSYILNPSADLKGTETTLNPALSKLAASRSDGWSSIVGTAPSEEDFRGSLSKSSMLLYFGHGAGSQYISQRAIRRLDKCSEVVWLMGCSSGAVTEYDELEPTAVPLAYLVAGQQDPQQEDRSKCMAVVSTLWDVTDKDIDRFSLAVGEEWGLWASESESTKLPAKTPRKREKLAAPSTPEKVPKTPKTPKVKKTPAPARTPARSRSRPRGGEDGKQSLVEAVARSRDACYLRYLNGAAPVVYGVPVYLGD
ncbi:hypothetical protein M409DRAFT_71401 [Zasmidium cellare ATCC 36951]|uniref:separase n=1 Tax=Zasmidium cellare ATCC 36951 TaxID=1080233 RepID=A0A6A6BWG2_ZASCE|nr:uncharacterized protein M409DRAFT_71401 [Zasmidium cellare ATCC 36951]KAF2158923.1 hypothetical protein M409DRAFT_71401 [Zasmidium cellare ATCC 36951]